ncbi:MAG: ankyrin repeat domain-containing protein [Cyanobacteriota bacterium]|nr:ankyrin repeat domain-containing protein [Cyanobacteriota bacterium]
MKTLHATGDTIRQKYCILDVLGEGGSGTTYLARNLQTDEKVALKAMSLRNSGNWKLVELIEREARVLSQLNHPSIPQYLEYFQVDAPNDRTFYIAQQLVEGKSLADLVEKGWHATEQQIVAIAVQVLNVLIYLHALEPPVIHRDIKPENIIVKATANSSLDDSPQSSLLRRVTSREAKVSSSESGESALFLVDFGAVRDTYQSTLAGSTVVGTFGYMAPEQFQGRAIPATDLYGLGATLLFLLTHRSPAELPTHRLKLNFRSRVQVSRKLADWLEKMLEPHAEERFTSAKEALEGLQNKQQIKGNIRYISKKAIVGVSVAVVAAAFLFNSYKYAITSAVGIVPNWAYEAISHGNLDISSYERASLHDAVRTDNLKLVQLLLERGADVNAMYDNYTTVLHETVRYENPKMARLLLEHGADVNVKDRESQTPLHHAVWYKNLKMARLLLEHDADVNVKDRESQTPLHRAVLGKNPKMVRLLLQRGADVNVRDGRDSTPLHDAVWRKNLEIARLLLEHGADVNARNGTGSTPLDQAIWYEELEIARLLLEHDGDVNVR